MKTLWAGRFGKELDSQTNSFNSSIKFDCRLYRDDIEGSIAHASMLADQGIIKKEEAILITDGLRSILSDIESGKLEFDMTSEDIHMFIEATLTSRIGDAGKKLHTARSRNDQVALDIRLYLRRECGEIIKLIMEFLSVIRKKAAENTETIMPGYTHMQRAQPVTFAHHILAYAFMLSRDAERFGDCRKRMNKCPLGSGALAGTTHPIDRLNVSCALNFDDITENSIDGVSDRDFIIEMISSMSILMMHLSRFSEEIILWCSSEFGFLELDDAFSTGSSIMPQKKNPDIAELVRGKTGRVYGSLITLLTVMKGLPLAYNKDMQEDKEAVFDALDNTKLSLGIFAKMFETSSVRADRMRLSAETGYLNATDCADYLVKQGMPFRDAYKVTGKLIGKYASGQIPLESLGTNELNSCCAELGLPQLFCSDVYSAISLETCVKERKSAGGPALDSVLKQISRLDEIIEEFSK